MRSITSLFFRKQTTIGSAAVILMLMVFASRVLGLVRDRMLASQFRPDELGVYFAAFRIPNFLFELLVTGVLTSAFIPVFTKYLAKEKEAEAWQIASTLMNIGSILMAVCSIPLLLFTPLLVKLIAPGFTQPEQEQMVLFTRWMLFFQVVPLMIGNFFTGILQSYNLFLLPALAPVVYNVGIILCVVFLSSSLGLLAPVIGVGVGALFFVLIQIPALWSVGFRYQLKLSLKHAGVREVGKLMAPRTFGLAISQIDMTVDLVLATILGAKMVTIFHFAQHLQQLPVGLFGATIAQAVLPSLSFAAVKEEKQRFIDAIISAIHQMLFFVLPLSILFVVLRIPIVRLVFGSALFDWEATVLTGMTVSMFSISLFAQSVIHVLARGFYALYDTKTPVIIGAMSIFINTTLSIVCIMVYHLPVWSLGLSTSVASIFQAFLLFILLNKRIPYLWRSDFLIPPLKMFTASLIMGVMLYIPLKLLDQLVFDTTRTFNLLLLAGISSTAGFSSYLFLSWVFGVGQVDAFLRLVGKVRYARNFFLEPAGEVVQESVHSKVG